MGAMIQEPELIDYVYRATPTGTRFHLDLSFFRGIMGPIGSGKSVCCVEELKRNALWVQKPGPDGVRRTRWAIVRNTYPELKATTIKTFLQWWDDQHVNIVYGAPITATVEVELEDDTRVHAEFLFLALDKPKDVKKLLSLELTGIWFNEAREIPKTVIDAGMGRVGRYPSLKDGVGPTRAFGIADTNPPDDDHWWYKLAEEDTPDNWAFFRQPAALLKDDNGAYHPNPKAENIVNLADGYDYYLRQVSGKDPEWIKVYLLGDYGTVQEGKPVYPTFRSQSHVAKHIIRPVPGLGLLLGWDFGLTPACIIGQLTKRGQLRLLDELLGEDIGITRFARDVVKPHLAKEYAGFIVTSSTADPAGGARAETDEQTAIGILNSTKVNMGFRTRPASTNNPLRRIEAVSGYLNLMVDGEPGLLVSPKCRLLIKGFNGGYKYERVQVTGDERYRDTPCKNKFSHPHDAVQYLTLGATSGGIVTDYPNTGADQRPFYG